MLGADFVHHAHSGGYTVGAGGYEYLSLEWRNPKSIALFELKYLWHSRMESKSVVQLLSSIFSKIASI